MHRKGLLANCNDKLGQLIIPSHYEMSPYSERRMQFSCHTLVYSAQIPVMKIFI